MLRHRKRGMRCAGGAAVVVVACLPLTSCDSRSAHADSDSVGYVAIVSSSGASGPVVERAVNTVVAVPEAAVPVQPPVEPIGPVPPYTVIAQRTSDRSDKATTYYVVLGSVAADVAPAAPAVEGSEPVQLLSDAGAPAELVADMIVPVDPVSASFKPAVKQVLRSLASINGGPEFSAHIWDETTAAQTEVSFKSAPDLFTNEQYAAKEGANSRHLVASYQGGVEPEGQPAAYILFWFPDAGVDDPVGRALMSSEVWQPRT